MDTGTAFAHPSQAALLSRCSCSGIDHNIHVIFTYKESMNNTKIYIEIKHFIFSFHSITVQELVVAQRLKDIAFNIDIASQ